MMRYILKYSIEMRNDMASYVGPAVQSQFETLSIDLKNVILEKNVQLNTMYDLIHVLEEISKEDD